MKAIKNFSTYYKNYVTSTREAREQYCMTSMQQSCSLSKPQLLNKIVCTILYFIPVQLITSCSMATASHTMPLILLGDGLCLSFLYMRQAKSQWRPSSLLISSFEKVRPDISPLGRGRKERSVTGKLFKKVKSNPKNRRFSNRFLSQKMAAKEPEKNIPSTAANAMILSPKEAFFEPIHCNAQSAFLFTHGTT